MEDYYYYYEIFSKLENIELISIQKSNKLDHTVISVINEIMTKRYISLIIYSEIIKIIKEVK